MVRGNCDYLFLQPIYNKTQRDVLWDLEAAFMHRDDWNTLMDQVIERENLEGNTAQEPKKKVRIMVCCDFEDSAIPTEKFYHWTPVHMDLLPKFRLCHKKYWDKSLAARPLFSDGSNALSELNQITGLEQAEAKLKKL